jgi:hypothetical protein
MRDSGDPDTKLYSLHYFLSPSPRQQTVSLSRTVMSVCFSKIDQFVCKLITRIGLHDTHQALSGCNKILDKKI